jgi:dipeptidyl aminopeptidase/acylaminoacyl peptidase
MLDVKSEPNGATVDVDGRAQGLTPLHLALSPGAHHVTLQRAGFASTTYDVTLSEKGTTSLVAELWAQSPEIDELRPPFPGASIASVDFLRDGEVVLSVAVGSNGERQIWLVDGRGAGRRIGPSTDSAAITASPDGSHVAFLHSGPGPAFGAILPAEVWVAGLNGDQPKRVDLWPPSEVRFDDLSWGLDGRHLLVIGHISQAMGGQSSRLLWVDVVSGQSRELITLPSVIVRGSYRWSPDGQQVAFLTQTDQLTSLCLIAVPDGDFHYLGDLGRDATQVFPFAPVAWSSDTQHLLYMSLSPEQTSSSGWLFSSAPASRLIVADATQPAGRPLSPTGLVPLTWDLNGSSAVAITLAQPSRNGPLVLRRVELNGTTSDLLELSLRSAGPFVARWDDTHRQAIVAVRGSSGFGGSQWQYWLVRFAPELPR